MDIVSDVADCADRRVIAEVLMVKVSDGTKANNLEAHVDGVLLRFPDCIEQRTSQSNVVLSFMPIQQRRSQGMT